MAYLKIGGVLLASTLALGAFLGATEVDEIRERAEAMRREAAELAERGHGEEAERLQQEAQAMLEAAERLLARSPQRAQIHQMREQLERLRLEERALQELDGSEAQRERLRDQARAFEQQIERLAHAMGKQGPHAASVRELHERLEQLHQQERELRAHEVSEERLADVRREAQRVEEQIHELMHDRESHPRREAAERLEHMRAAVTHLRHAGLHDMAAETARRAEAAERELHAHGAPGRQPDVLREVVDQLRDLRNEVERLRDQVSELQERRERQERQERR